MTFNPFSRANLITFEAGSTPTTSAPTTSAPTTSAPTTPAPTTPAPTTSAPNNLDTFHNYGELVNKSLLDSMNEFRI